MLNSDPKKKKKKKRSTSPENALLTGNVFPNFVHFVPRREKQWPDGYSLIAFVFVGLIKCRYPGISSVSDFSFSYSNMA